MQVIVALAAPAILKIELERDCGAHCRDCSLDRGLGKKGPAEVGVQNRPGKIENRAEAWLFLTLKHHHRFDDHLVRSVRNNTMRTGFRKETPYGSDDGGAPETIDRPG